MPIRTWIPGLILVLKAARHYMTKWNSQLHDSLTSPQYTCLMSTLTAIIDCLNLLEVE